MLHALALVGTIVALRTSSASFGVSITVPVICQDYRVGSQVVTRCNDGQPLTAPIGGVPLGRQYLPGSQHVVDPAQVPAPESAPTQPTNKAQ